MQYHIDAVNPDKGETFRLAKEFGQQLIDNCREALSAAPVYKDGELCRFALALAVLISLCTVTFPTAPHTEVSAKGDIVYSEVVRENVRKLEQYVKGELYGTLR
jgi:fatty acid synthase subunit beta